MTTTGKPSLVRRALEIAGLIAVLAVLASLTIPQFISFAPIEVPLERDCPTPTPCCTLLRNPYQGRWRGM